MKWASMPILALEKLLLKKGQRRKVLCSFMFISEKRFHQLTIGLHLNTSDYHFRKLVSKNFGNKTYQFYSNCIQRCRGILFFLREDFESIFIVHTGDLNDLKDNL